VKPAVFAAWRRHLQQSIDDLVRVSEAARAGTRVDGSHRPANRGERAAVTTQGYLTHGLGARLAELRAHLDLLDKVDPGPRTRFVMGAIVTLEGGARYALLPGGQGMTVHVDSVPTVILSPDAPLARALAGLEAGDEVSWRGRELEIVDMA